MLKKERIPLLIVIIVLGSILSPTFIQNSHAATGEVCLADPSTASSTSPCPGSPPTFDGPVGQQLKIGVYNSGSDGLDGFDITLLSNHTILRPAGVDLTGTVLLGTPVVLVECLSGVLAAGSGCSTTDTVDTLHLAAVSGLGNPLTTSPTTGLLFTAIYNITATTSGAITVEFQTGCSNTSVNPNVCVTIGNGTTTPSSETVQTGSFYNSNSPGMAVVALSAPQPLFGPEFPGVTNSTTVTATALNGYPGIATDSVSFNARTSSSALTATLSGSNPCVTSGSSCSVSLSLSASSFGNFSATVYGTYSTIDPSGNPDTLVSTVSFAVVVYDFSFSLSPTSLTFNAANSGSANIAVTSLNGFTGPVTLSTSTIVPTGLSITFGSNPVVLGRGGNATVTATLRASPTATTTYHVRMRASSGTRSETFPPTTFILVTVQVGTTPDFSIGASPSPVAVGSGDAGTSTISTTPFDGFNSTITLIISHVSGVSCSLSQSMVKVSTNSILSCTSSGGIYNVTVTGTSGFLSHSVTIQFAFLSTSSGLVCTAQDGSTTCPIIPPIISPIAPTSSQLRVSIVINNSTEMYGFDITLLTNSSILKPAVAIEGSVLGSNGLTIVANCVGGTGTGCTATDNKNTLHYAVASSNPAFAPVTGLLFTAVYNITGTTTGTGIEFQVGCTTTSVAGGVCVTIASGTPYPTPETTQTASFANLPTFSLQTLPPVISFNISPGSSNSTMFLNATSLNGFVGLVTLTGVVSPLGPTVQFVPASFQLNATIPIVFSAVNVTVARTVTPRNYALTISATGKGTTRSLTISLAVPAPDFSIMASPQAVTLDNGTSASASISLASISGFSANVALRAAGPTALDLALGSSSVSLNPNGVNSSSLLISTNHLTQPQTYLITVSGTAGPIVHTVSVTVNVADFALGITGTNGTFIMAQPGVSYAEVVSLRSVNNYAGTVNLTTIAPTYITANFLLPPLNLTVARLQLTQDSQFQFDLVIKVATDTPAGYYNVTVVAAGSISTREQQVIVKVSIPAPPSPDFSMSLNPNSITLTAGSNSSATVMIVSLNGFVGTLQLNTTVSPTPPSGTFLLQLNPSLVVLASGGSVTTQLSFSTTRSIPVYTDYDVEVLATNGTLSREAVIPVYVIPAPHVPPVASFTFSPTTPFVGESIAFDGSSSSSSDGFIVQWTWNFGDSSGIYGSSNPITYHSYLSPGNYTVTLTVQDDFDLLGTKSVVISIIPQPAHDVGISQVFVYPNIVVSSQNVGVEVYLTNMGLNNETVSLTSYYSGHLIKVVSGIILYACRTNGSPCFYTTYEDIVWNTTGVLPGNYTISVSVSLPKGETDPTPADNNFTDGIITVLPPPMVVVNPNSGPVGARIQITASGFEIPNGNEYLYPEPIWVTFDDNFLGEAFVQNGTFTFTFNVIQAQPGTHQIIAMDMNTGAKATALFTVASSPTGTLTITINTGTLYFPRDKVTIYVLTSFNGIPIGPANVQLRLSLFKPNGSNVTLTPLSIGTGIYEATYMVPSTGPLGTYLVAAKANMTSPFNSSTITSFEVKPTWLSSNGGNIAGIATAVGLVGLVGVTWKKGYFKKRRKDEPADPF